jgi:hypothetical protein
MASPLWYYWSSFLANIINKALLNAKLLANGKFLEVFRPRGQFLADIGYIAKAMEQDGSKTIPLGKIDLFVGVLEKAIRELRDKKKLGMIIDFAKIPLQEQVNLQKKMTIKLVGAGNNTCGMLVMMQMQSSEELVSEDDKDEDPLTVYLPVNKKKHTSSSM